MYYISRCVLYACIHDARTTFINKVKEWQELKVINKHT